MQRSAVLPAMLVGVLGGALGGEGVAQGRVYAPRVQSPHIADAPSMKAFAEFRHGCNLIGHGRGGVPAAAREPEVPAQRHRAVERQRARQPTPAWVEPMKRVHARFTGRRGTFAHFGDSITISRAFWFSLRYSRKNAPPEMRDAFRTVSPYMIDDCWDWKGPEFGNQGRMTIRWAHANIDKWLKRLNPEVALIMFGTNDLNSLGLEEYEAKTRQVVQKCLANGTVVILSTIPPRHRFQQKAAKFADAVRRIARGLHVPLTDFHAEIIRRRPDDWDGASDKFSAYRGYDVPTLIARDGVHPSNPKKYRGDYSPEALRSNGFSLRNYLVLLKYAEVIRNVLLRHSGREP